MTNLLYHPLLKEALSKWSRQMKVFSVTDVQFCRMTVMDSLAIEYLSPSLNDSVKIETCLLMTLSVITATSALTYSSPLPNMGKKPSNVHIATAKMSAAA